MKKLVTKASELDLPDWSETSKAIFRELYGNDYFESIYGPSKPDTIDVEHEVVAPPQLPPHD